jgi:hypothetical protein
MDRKTYSPQLLMGKLSGVGAGIIGYDLAFAVEFPFVDEQAAFEFTIYEL